MSSDNYKRTTSLLQNKPELIVDIDEKWKKKQNVPSSTAGHDTHTRLYVPASNIERQPDDGCMRKIKIERSLKLNKED